MPTDAPSLLPPNATPLERALEQATARVDTIETPIATLWDPATIAPDLLPWLGWALSIDRWETTWSVDEKRAAVAAAIAMQRRKGTRATVESVMASFDELLELVEWWEQTPRVTPHTFELRLPMDGAGGTRSTAAFAEAIIREVSKVKPLRSHFALLQTIATTAQIGVIGAARLTLAARFDGIGAPDTSQAWSTFLQTEHGEPLQLEDLSSFLQEESA